MGSGSGFSLGLRLGRVKVRVRVNSYLAVRVREGYSSGGLRLGSGLALTWPSTSSESSAVLSWSGVLMYSSASAAVRLSACAGLGLGHRG